MSRYPRIVDQQYDDILSQEAGYKKRIIDLLHQQVAGWQQPVSTNDLRNVVINGKIDSGISNLNALLGTIEDQLNSLATQSASSLRGQTNTNYVTTFNIPQVIISWNAIALLLNETMMDNELRNLVKGKLIVLLSPLTSIKATSLIVMQRGLQDIDAEEESDDTGTKISNAVSLVSTVSKIYCAISLIKEQIESTSYTYITPESMNTKYTELIKRLPNKTQEDFIAMQQYLPKSALPNSSGMRHAVELDEQKIGRELSPAERVNLMYQEAGVSTFKTPLTKEETDAMARAPALEKADSFSIAQPVESGVPMGSTPLMPPEEPENLPPLMAIPPNSVKDYQDALENYKNIEDPTDEDKEKVIVAYERAKESILNQPELYPKGSRVYKEFMSLIEEPPFSSGLPASQQSGDTSPVEQALPNPSTPTSAPPATTVRPKEAPEEEPKKKTKIDSYKPEQIVKMIEKGMSNDQRSHLARYIDNMGNNSKKALSKKEFYKVLKEFGLEIPKSAGPLNNTIESLYKNYILMKEKDAKELMKKKEGKGIEMEGRGQFYPIDNFDYNQSANIAYNHNQQEGAGQFYPIKNFNYDQLANQSGISAGKLKKYVKKYGGTLFRVAYAPPRQENYNFKQYDHQFLQTQNRNKMMSDLIANESIMADPTTS